MAGPLKAALGCLAHILRACDPQSDFAEAAPSFALLLKYNMDERQAEAHNKTLSLSSILNSTESSPNIPKQNS